MKDEHGVKRLWLPGDDDGVAEVDGPDIVLQEVAVSEITDTNLADAQADRSTFKAQLEEGTMDLGGGMLMKEEPVVIQRDVNTGRIVKMTPVTEIPGVEYTRGKIDFEKPVVEKEAKQELYPVDRDQRTKLVGIMASRLLKHYKKLAEDYPGYNPLRDGVPELPAGSPEFLTPNPGTPLYPATEGQVFDYLKREVGKRAHFINKRRFGDGVTPDLRDLTVHIE